MPFQVCNSDVFLELKRAIPRSGFVIFKAFTLAGECNSLLCIFYSPVAYAVLTCMESALVAAIVVLF